MSTVPPGLRAGFIGLGNQGSPMARRIVDQGLPLTIWARRPQSLAPFADTEAAVAASPAELGANSDVVGICVVGDDDVRDVVLRADGVLAGMRAGSVIAIHATVHPDTCRDVAAAAASKGVSVVDAPVSGGASAAADGRLLVMVGGDADDVERCRPVFETFGSPVVHLGPLGSGQVAKVINNLVFTAHVGVALDTFEFGERLGVDREALALVLRSGSGASFASTIVGGGGVTGLAGAASLLRKDVDIAADIARQRGVQAADSLTGLAEAAIAALSRAQ